MEELMPIVVKLRIYWTDTSGKVFEVGNNNLRAQVGDMQTYC